jgi:hypothetical protein
MHFILLLHECIFASTLKRIMARKFIFTSGTLKVFDSLNSLYTYVRLDAIKYTLVHTNRDGSLARNFHYIINTFLMCNQVFTFRIYEIYKGKYWFHSKNFGNFFLLKTCFLPIKSHKTWKKAIKKFPSVTRRRRRCRRRRRRGQNIFTRLQPRPLELESWNFGSLPHLGQLSVLHTQNFEIQLPKGSHLREVFRGFAV